MTESVKGKWAVLPDETGLRPQVVILEKVTAKTTVFRYPQLPRITQRAAKLPALICDNQEQALNALLEFKSKLEPFSEEVVRLQRATRMAELVRNQFIKGYWEKVE